MNRLFNFRFYLTVCLLCCRYMVVAQNAGQAGADTLPFRILHGPYLQEVTGNAATVVYETSDKAFSWVEVKRHGASDEEARRCRTSRDGLFEAYNTFGSVRIHGLDPATGYDYRIVSKQMTGFQPYKVTFGDSIATPWYTFSTVNPRQKGLSVFVTSDMHGNASKLEKLLALADYKSCDAFFYAGDMMNYIDSHEAPFKSFIDSSVKLFASSKPFEVVRGNHETRGNCARSYSAYFPKENGKIYGSYLLGDVMVVMLDSGEDKAESHWVYAGLTDYDAYRTEQAEWLKRLVASEAYRKARYRIVICHFPMVLDPAENEDGIWHGWEDAIRKFRPILNGAKVDLLVSGHTHRYLFHTANSAGNRFPVLEQGAESATRLELHDGKVHVKVIDVEGRVLHDAFL